MSQEILLDGKLYFAPNDKRTNLLRRLEDLANDPRDDPEVQHSEADELLLQYIGDAEITAAFLKLKRWYS